MKIRNRSTVLPLLNGHVQFDNVSFAYEEGKPVLHHISFDARPGTVTALVGSSGSGKSTMIGLINAFHSPTEGKVLVDGFDLSTVSLASYRVQLGLVLQESFLFDGLFARTSLFHDPVPPNEEILEACRIANVDEFASKLAGWLRHRCRRTRRQTERRPEAACVYRPGHPGGPAHSDSG